MNQRLLNLSSTKEAFDCFRPLHQKALDDGRHKYDLVHQETTKLKKSKRTRTPMYFNLRFSKSVKTNIIKTLLCLIDKHFPKGHKLHKCFNRNSVEATYCTMSNMKQIVGKHNAKLLNSTSNDSPAVLHWSKKILAPLLHKHY